MKVVEAKQLALDLMSADVVGALTPVLVDPTSPDPSDPGKFTIQGQPARAIHHHSGWHVPIDLGWFHEGFDRPRINDEAFYWYVFAIPRRSRYRRDHYFVCDYLQMREWVLDFTAPLGKDYRNQTHWRADLRIFTDEPEEHSGYFRWGDEPPRETARAGRVFRVDNVATIGELAVLQEHVGLFGPGGESEAHRRLKLYVAAHATEFGLSTAARAFVEYPFRTGDRVDVLFENHRPDRTVVEIEVDGEDNVCVGIQQAVKYRSLAQVESGYSLISPRVQSLVVAYDTDYPRARALGERYDVALASVQRDLVLATAE